LQRSKQHALMFLLGVFLTGGALGFTADRVLVRERIRDCQRGDQRAMRTRMGDDLGLSAEQRASLDRILDEKHRQMSVLLAPVRPRMDSISAATRTQIRAILTPAQQADFEKLHREAARTRSSERR
jgi:hypothetical protein